MLLNNGHTFNVLLDKDHIFNMLLNNGHNFNMLLVVITLLAGAAARSQKAKKMKERSFKTPVANFISAQRPRHGDSRGAELSPLTDASFLPQAKLLATMPLRAAPRFSIQVEVLNSKRFATHFSI